jgi:formate hydrogenlyase subunit 6/NADH:ubiquinone oxidoreductase subunit I
MDTIDISALSREKCCGCGACAAICPADAIHIALDTDGFWHPSLDGDACRHCGLCVKVCRQFEE